MMISNPRTRLASIESEERRSMVLTDRFKFRANQTIQNARKKEAERLLMEKENWIRGTTRNPRGESRYTCKRNNNNTGSWRYYRRWRGGANRGEKVSWEFLGLRAVSCRWPYGGRVYWPAAKRSRVSWRDIRGPCRSLIAFRREAPFYRALSRGHDLGEKIISGTSSRESNKTRSEPRIFESPCLKD